MDYQPSYGFLKDCLYRSESYKVTLADAYCGRVACGWLFCYRIICSMDIPAHDQESFAGAVGCLIADDGEIRDLSGQMFMDMLHMVA